METGKTYPYADVAQLVELLPSKQIVVGSNPIVRFYSYGVT